MLGQSEEALLIDNRSLSKLSQGITTEITGEGASAAPQNQRTLAQIQPGLDQYHLKVDWSTLAEYFARLEKSGTPLNIDHGRVALGAIADEGSDVRFGSRLCKNVFPPPKTAGSRA